MKVGICVTTHRSEKIRPNGAELLTNFLNSFRDSRFKFDYTIYVSDNQSETPYEYPTDLNIKVQYIEDQTIRGLTGAWNLSYHRAYEDGCDIIWSFNDDIELNPSINAFVAYILEDVDKDRTVYGPASNNGGSSSPNTYARAEVGVKELTLAQGSWRNLPNGFSFAFSRTFYETFRYKDNEFFPIEHSLNGGDGKWGGQEGYFGLLVSRGLKAVVLKFCWLKHVKFRHWVIARDTLK